jgi:hypothetical protein
MVNPSVLGKTCKNKLRERYTNYTQICTVYIVATDVFENDNWAQKGSYRRFCLLYAVVGSWREEIKISLIIKKKLADETLTSLSTGSNSTSQGYSVGLLLSLRNYRALVYM